MHLKGEVVRKLNHYPILRGPSSEEGSIMGGPRDTFRWTRAFSCKRASTCPGLNLFITWTMTGIHPRVMAVFL